jgi:CRP-like cAMP-binding protein
MMLLVHAANVLTLVSYLVKDILWLRVLACVAGAFTLLYLFTRPEPPLVAIGWNLVFFAINVAQIWILVLERRPVQLREDEQRLYQLVFRALRPREFVRLLALGTWEERAPAEVIVTAGRELDRVWIILDGRARVSKDGKPIVELGAGRFVGEMSFLTGQKPAADVACASTTKLVAWPSATLKRFLVDNPDIRAAMQLIIGTDLVAKLR